MKKAEIAGKEMKALEETESEEEPEEVDDGEEKIEVVLHGKNEAPAVVITANGYGHEMTLPEENLNKKDEKSEAKQSFIELSNQSFGDNLPNCAEDEKENDKNRLKGIFYRPTHINLQYRFS